MPVKFRDHCPMGLKLLGANLACIEHRQISQNLIVEYQKSQIIVCAWCANEPEQPCYHYHRYTFSYRLISVLAIKREKILTE